MTTWPKVRERGDGRWIIDCGTINGKRRQYSRATESAAKTKAKELRDERDRVGVLAVEMSPKQRVEAAECFEMLKGVGTLTEAVKSFIGSRTAASEIETVMDLYEDLMSCQEGRGLAPRSISSTRCQLKPFISVFGPDNMRDITVAMVRTWIDTQAIANPTTKNKLIRYLSLLFRHGIREEVITTNPMDKIDRAQVEYSLPEIFKPEQVAAIFDAAWKYDCEMIPRFAIGFFAGVRTCELDKLDWSSVNLDDRILTVLHTKTSSGTSQRIPRHVTIADNLFYWLHPFARSSGSIGLGTKAFNIRRQHICKKAGIKAWPHNVMRHSYATYHLASGDSAEKTALELGHMQGTKVLFRHYRGLATKKEGTEYWNIRPEWGDWQQKKKTDPEDQL